MANPADVALRRPRIGVFDSGVGGLTVLRALRERAPHCDFLYLGDTARLPYGTKSPATVCRYAQRAAGELVARDVEVLVVACNTASAHALDVLRARWPALPVIGVVEPGARAAVRTALELGRADEGIGVLATEATVRSGAYADAIVRVAPVPVRQQACSVFVALAEEGWCDGPVVRGAARSYLDAWSRPRTLPSVLLLGCTHFPVLAGALRSTLAELGAGESRIVDSASTTADAVAALPALARSTKGTGEVSFLATDGAERFARVGRGFLGRTIEEDAVEIVDLLDRGAFADAGAAQAPS